MKKVKVLSLYDGMSCGNLALRLAGLEPELYVAYEIDAEARKAAAENFPDIVLRGDVTKANFRLERRAAGGFDFLLGGSPCTYWTISQTNGCRETRANSGPGWGLFSHYARAVREAKPEFFVYENNASMTPAIREEIERTFGFAPLEIDSRLISPQHRERLYWVGRRDPDPRHDGRYLRVPVDPPRNLRLRVRDILDAPPDDGGPAPRQAWMDGIAEPPPERMIKVGQYPGKDGRIRTSQGYGILSADGAGYCQVCGDKDCWYALRDRAGTVEVCNGRAEIKGMPVRLALPDGRYTIRRLTTTERAKMQTVPDGYRFPASAEKAAKLIGNGWTVAIIVRLLRACARMTEAEGEK